MPNQNTHVPAAACGLPLPRAFPAFEPIAGFSGNDARPNLQPSLPRAFPDFSCTDINTTAPDRMDIHTVADPLAAIRAGIEAFLAKVDGAA